MSKEYDAYLKQHRENVTKGYRWMHANLPDLIRPYPGAEYIIIFAHDNSKDNPDEYNTYDAYFYGRNRSYQVVQDFRHAWLRHIHRNPHHWQYWVLQNDDPSEGEIVLDMPGEFVIEMICDWWAFSWASGNLMEIFNWYEAHKDYIKLSDETREMVEQILTSIKEKL